MVVYCIHLTSRGSPVASRGGFSPIAYTVLHTAKVFSYMIHPQCIIYCMRMRTGKPGRKERKKKRVPQGKGHSCRRWALPGGEEDLNPTPSSLPSVRGVAARSRLPGVPLTLQGYLLVPQPSPGRQDRSHGPGGLPDRGPPLPGASRRPPRAPGGRGDYPPPRSRRSAIAAHSRQ